METVITEFRIIRVVKKNAEWEVVLDSVGRECWELAAIVEETSTGMTLVLQRKKVV